jgi:hypothetical protein
MVFRDCKTKTPKGRWVLGGHVFEFINRINSVSWTPSIVGIFVTYYIFATEANQLKATCDFFVFHGMLRQRTSISSDDERPGKRPCEEASSSDSEYAYHAKKRDGMPESGRILANPYSRSFFFVDKYPHNIRILTRGYNDDPVYDTVVRRRIGSAAVCEQWMNLKVDYDNIADQNLPSDVVFYISSFLNSDDLLSFSATCKLTRVVLVSPQALKTRLELYSIPRRIALLKDLYDTLQEEFLYFADTGIIERPGTFNRKRPGQCIPIGLMGVGMFIAAPNEKEKVVYYDPLYYKHMEDSTFPNDPDNATSLSPMFFVYEGVLVDEFDNETDGIQFVCVEFSVKHKYFRVHDMIRNNISDAYPVLQVVDMCNGVQENWVVERLVHNLINGVLLWKSRDSSDSEEGSAEVFDETFDETFDDEVQQHTSISSDDERPGKKPHEESPTSLTVGSLGSSYSRPIVLD